MNEPGAQAQIAPSGKPGVPGAASLEKTIHSGANWLYWIAGLSLVNTLAAHSGANLFFVAGTMLTGMMDAATIMGEVPMAVTAVVDGLVVGGFTLLGRFAHRRSGAAFLVGIILYCLDSLLLFLVPMDAAMLFSMGFHVFCLISVVLGYRALRRLTSLERAQALQRARAAALVRTPAAPYGYGPGFAPYPQPPPPPGAPEDAAQDPGVHLHGAAGGAALVAAPTAGPGVGLGAGPAVAPGPADPGPPPVAASAGAPAAGPAPRSGSSSPDGRRQPFNLAAHKLVSVQGWLMQRRDIKHFAFVREHAPPRPYGPLQHIWTDLRAFPANAIWLLGLGLTTVGALSVSQGATSSALWSLLPGVVILFGISRMAGRAIRMARHGVLREVRADAECVLPRSETKLPASLARLRVPAGDGARPLVTTCYRWVVDLMEQQGAITVLLLSLDDGSEAILVAARAEPRAGPSA